MSTQWFEGPPPSVGWWPASRMRLSSTLRWWNGVCWSQPAYSNYTRTYVARIANTPATNCGIEWTHRPKNWPKRSMT